MGRNRPQGTGNRCPTHNTVCIIELEFLAIKHFRARRQVIVEQHVLQTGSSF